MSPTPALEPRPSSGWSTRAILEGWTPVGVDQGPSGPTGNASIPFDQSRGRDLRLSVSLPGS